MRSGKAKDQLHAPCIVVQSGIHIEHVKAMQDKRKVQGADNIHRILSACVLLLENLHNSITHLENQWIIMKQKNITKEYKINHTNCSFTKRI